MRDDGHGFDREHLRSATLGLVAMMEERAIAPGGRWHGDSTPGTGTAIRLERPLGSP